MLEYITTSKSLNLNLCSIMLLNQFLSILFPKRSFISYGTNLIGKVRANCRKTESLSNLFHFCNLQFGLEFIKDCLVSPSGQLYSSSGRLVCLFRLFTAVKRCSHVIIRRQLFFYSSHATKTMRVGINFYAKRKRTRCWVKMMTFKAFLGRDVKVAPLRPTN